MAGCFIDIEMRHRRYAFLSMHDAIEDAQLPKEAYQNNPRAGGILGPVSYTHLRAHETDS